MSVPTMVADWEEENGRCFLLSKRIEGQTLDVAWPNMTTDDKERVARQTAGCILRLRDFQSPQMQSLGGQPIYSGFLFLRVYTPGSPRCYNVAHGPFSSDDELSNEMEKSRDKVPVKARQRLRELMPPAAPFTFTCCDLSNENIVVKDGNFAGINGWDTSGYFPTWWNLLLRRLAFCLRIRSGGSF